MNRFIYAAAAFACVASTADAIEYQSAMQTFLDGSVMSWSQDSILIDAINAQNTAHSNLSQSDIDGLDLAWRAEVGGSATPMVDGVLMNAAADFLRSQVEATGGAITEVFIMDNHGLNVAASGVTSDYWQGDEAKFQKTYSMGADAVHFSDVEFDESSQSYQAQISISLTDPATGAVIGAMTVGVDADLLM